jgi:hypothetical protein
MSELDVIVIHVRAEQAAEYERLFAERELPRWREYKARGAFLSARMSAKISAGRLVALHSGPCDLTVTLAIQGTIVFTKRAHLTLPGAIPLGQGIRLLAAHHYPASAERAESADNGHPSAVRHDAGASPPLDIGEWTY